MSDSKEKSKVLVQEADYSSVGAVVKKIFQNFPLSLKDKLVWVKPNILTDTPAEKAVTTHPSIVEAVVEYLLKQGAKVVVGDNSGARSYGANERAARRSGIINASCGCYRNIGTDVVNITLALKEKERVTVSKIVRECDIMISIPKLKTHLQTIITAGIKNSYGILAGTSKMDLHRKYQNFCQFSKVVSEVYNIRKPDLIILDAIVCLEGDGPNTPYLRNCNQIIASNDGISLDIVAAKIIGANVNFIPMITYAMENNIDISDYENIEIIGKIKKIDNFILPRTYGKRNSKATLKERLIAFAATSEKLKVSESKCISCKKCYESCPVGAVTMREKAFINQNKCILCYCCKEICPTYAVEFSSAYGFMQKIYQKFFSN